MSRATHGHRKRTDNEGNRRKWDGTYGSWREMKRRCLDPGRPDFRYYGAIGVQVCPQWVIKPGGFEQFLKDLGARPEGHSLDRIDAYGHYEPDNCRWREAWANSADNRQATGYVSDFYDEDEVEFQIEPKWPELVVVVQQYIPNNEDWPF